LPSPVSDPSMNIESGKGFSKRIDHEEECLPINSFIEQARETLLLFMVVKNNDAPYL